MRSFTFTKRSIQERKEHRSIGALLPPEALSTVMQVRRTLEVGDLFDSVLEHGQQTPGVAVVLTPREAKLYLAELNQIYGANHAISELIPVMLDGKRYCFILIAGHRRLETCLSINKLVARGELSFTEKYRGLYRVELRFGLSTKEAIALQFNENRHVQVPPHEEAHAAWGFWMWLRRHEPEMTIARFAKIIGRSSDWVRSALRFCELPRSVQEYVGGEGDKPKLPYRVLVEVARLADGYQTISGEVLPEDAYHKWLTRAVLGRLDATAFGRLVSGYLGEKRAEKHGQLTLFGGSETVGLDERPIRRIVAPELVVDIWRWLEYLKIVTRLQQSGQLERESFLGPEHDVRVRARYSPGSPLRLLAEASNLHGDLLPHLIELARLEGGRYRRALKHGEPLVTDAREILRLLVRLEESGSIH